MSRLVSIIPFNIMSRTLLYCKVPFISEGFMRNTLQCIRVFKRKALKHFLGFSAENADRLRERNVESIFLFYILKIHV